MSRTNLKVFSNCGDVNKTKNKKQKTAAPRNSTGLGQCADKGIFLSNIISWRVVLSMQKYHLRVAPRAISNARG
jgi:hypothetical protein